MRWWKSGQQWEGVKRGRGEDPVEIVECRRARSPAEAPMKFLNVWFIYMCGCNDALV